ncbi:MAG TPA: hypothetical protein VFF91_10225, partial [Pseudoxanthomonas sp.]|nr:hypothetical protein [Pseudoxanthomonas sp.]
MKLRLLTGLALVLALGGCASYGYVGSGGGYYTGEPVTTYRYYERHGYPYGYPYGYSYSPGWSYGLGYGYYPYSRG